MSNTSLQEAVQEFLDAEIMLEQRRAEEGDTALQRETFTLARERLGTLLADTQGSTEQSFIGCVKAYIAAVSDFEAARNAQSGHISEPFQRLQAAQRALQQYLCRCPPACHAGKDQHHRQRRRFLVAIDGSESSTRAVETAVQLAEELNAVITLVCVETVHPEEKREPPGSAAALDRPHQLKARTILQQAQHRIPNRIESTVLERSGNPVSEIVNVARRWAADFIIMGSRGHSRIARFLLGSTAASVIRLAPCPVITVAHALLGCKPGGGAVDCEIDEDSLIAS